MRSTLHVHIDESDSEIYADLLSRHGVATVTISQSPMHDLTIFGDADRLELLGRKCIEIADELRAAMAAKNEVAA